MRILERDHLVPALVVSLSCCSVHSSMLCLISKHVLPLGKAIQLLILTVLGVCSVQRMCKSSGVSTDKFVFLLHSYYDVELTDGCWSPTRPGVYYLTKMDGSVDVWDLTFKQSSPALTLQVCELPVSISLYKMKL